MKKILLLTFALAICCWMVAGAANGNLSLSNKAPQVSKTAQTAHPSNNTPVEITKVVPAGSTTASAPVTVNKAAELLSNRVSDSVNSLEQKAKAEAEKAEAIQKAKDSNPTAAVPPDPNVILQGGDTFASATAIASLPYSDAGTTAGYTNDYSGSCGGSTAADVVYSYACASDQTVTVSLCGSSFDTILHIYQDDSSTQIGCNDDFCSVQSEIDNMAFTAGHTYYFVVDGYSTYSGDYTINVTEYTPPVCNPDVFVTVPAELPYSNDNTTCGKGNDFSNTCLGSYDGGEDIIYELTVTSDVALNFLVTPQDSWTGIAIDDACPPDPASCIAYATNAGATPYQLTGIPLSAGTYYIMLDTWPTPDCFDFNLQITTFVPLECPTPNTPEGEPTCYDEYVDMTNGGCNSDPTVFGTISEGETICGTSGDYLYTGLNYRDTDWYTLTLAENRQITISGEGDFSGSLFIITPGASDPCGGLAITYSTAITQGIPFSLTATLSAGYYWVWVGADGSGANPCGSVYYITATGEEPPPAPANDECANAQAITGPYPVTVPGTTIGATMDCAGVLNWNAVWYTIDLPYATNNLSIDFCPTLTDIGAASIGVVYYYACDDCANYTIMSYTFPTCPSGMVNPILTATGIPGPTTLYFPAYISTPEDFIMEVNVEVPPPPPANDLCADAIPVSVGNSVTGTTVSATVDSDFPTCITNITAPGVWYSVPGTGNTITVSTCNAFTTFDTKINVYCNECGDPVCIGGNDDDCTTYGLRSTVTFCSDPTATYMVLVHGYNVAFGDFQLDVSDDGVSCSDPMSCIPVPPPANDQCVNVSPVPLVAGVPLTFYGDNTGARSNDCASFSSYPDVWEGFTTDECLDITIDYCGSPVVFGNSWLGLAADCDCNTVYSASSYDFTTCVDGNVTLRYTNIPAGTYYYPVMLDPINGSVGPYVLNVNGVACPPPPPDLCVSPAYANGAPGSVPNAYAAQCDPVYPFSGGCADDFILAADASISDVAVYCGFWNYPVVPSPADFLGINITFYADNGGVPGGEPVANDPACTHEDIIPGGVISTELIDPANYTFAQLPSGYWQIDIPITPVDLVAGTTYWMEFEPVMDYTSFGQVGWENTDSYTGNPVMQVFPVAGITTWTPVAGTDMAFCLKTANTGACVYIPGDINGNGAPNGIDVSYGVNYFKGGAVPPVVCSSCPEAQPFYAAGDVNASCQFNGIDITYFVSFLKGGAPLHFCADCPPAAVLSSPRAPLGHTVKEVGSGQ